MARPPAVNVGVEHQGAQHDTAVEHFGGADGLEETLERDRKKRKKCEENGCVLSYVTEGSS